MIQSSTHRVLLLAITLSLSGCLSGTKPSLSDNTALAPIVNEPQSLEYMGSDYFDNALSAAMSENTGQIAVAVAQPFSINNIPERMNAWLGAIGDSGGEVRATPAEGERDLAGIIGLIASAMIALKPLYQQLQQQFNYLPAKNYDATLSYRNDGGETMIEKGVFTRKYDL